MAGTQDQDWGNYWQGRAASEAGTALLGAAIETDAAIARLWAGVFDPRPATTRLVDLACGAGTALKAAHRAGLTDLTGIDIAAEAISVLGRDLPSAKGLVASAHSTGLASGGFDLVVSQFGLEYAGLQRAAVEVARLLAPGGAFAALIHLKDGAIAAECAAKLDELNALRDARFIAKAKKLFRALYASDGNTAQAAIDRANRAVTDFKPAMDRVQAMAAAQGSNSLAAHLYNGTARLYERRLAYSLSDVEGWLTAMTGEIAAYRGRMDSMLDSAQHEAGIRSALEVLRAAGFAPVEPQRITLRDGAAPAAWWVRAGATT
ncbi:MAG: class I SAM-dependent methyltransferase [Pseudomonadota bacterium]